MTRTPHAGRNPDESRLNAYASEAFPRPGPRHGLLVALSGPDAPPATQAGRGGVPGPGGSDVAARAGARSGASVGLRVRNDGPADAPALWRGQRELAIRQDIGRRRK